MLSRVYRDKRSIYRRGQKKVAIAILDSGIELSEAQKDKYFRGREVAYRSWVDDEGSGDGPSQDWKDTVGHGTHLATLLARVAPMAAIHVARVFKRSKLDLKRETKNVAQVNQPPPSPSTYLALFVYANIFSVLFLYVREGYKRG